ncbi:MAG: phosphoheptose isomerase [Pseudomonadota bacterium]|jgi:D-sedoheptulose 7-phosphate isomerase
MSQEVWRSNLKEAAQVLSSFLETPGNIEKCEGFSKILIEAYNGHKNVFTCGNGGSHCDSMHFAEELTGRYRKERRPLGALALGDPSHVTCVSNDYGFEHIFSRQIEGLGRKGDVLIGISTSGNSANVIRAVEAAKKIGIKTVALLGKDGGQLKNLVDLAIVVPAQTSDRIQEVHIKIIHIVIETVERALFPENYA